MFFNYPYNSANIKKNIIIKRNIFNHFSYNIYIFAAGISKLFLYKEIGN